MSLFVHLINQPKQAIINEMEKYKNTWNYYGISYLYLELLNQVEMPVFFVDILFECIHVDFNSRLSNVLHRLELGDGDV
jgi:L-cystine uptake protein TcyP (sodium:dicarboxylate symporter family)